MIPTIQGEDILSIPRIWTETWRIVQIQGEDTHIHWAKRDFAIGKVQIQGEDILSIPRIWTETWRVVQIQGKDTHIHWAKRDFAIGKVQIQGEDILSIPVVDMKGIPLVIPVAETMSKTEFLYGSAGRNTRT